jgi:hypothetical protein
MARKIFHDGVVIIPSPLIRTFSEYLRFSRRKLYDQMGEAEKELVSDVIAQLEKE